VRVQLQERLTVKQVVGMTVFVALLAMAVIDGATMLISPRRWFALPRWLRGQGTLTPEKNSSGWGAFQVRVIGAGLLGIALRIGYALFRDLWESFR
jgi:hypothetical protein